MLVLGLVATVGCYDSTWGESKRAQEHTAAALAPSALQGGPKALPPMAAHTFRLRAFATPAFAAETLEWTKEVTAIVDDANQIAAPAIGLRLELVSTTAWPGPAPDQQDLTASMVQLRTVAPAEDVEFVLGLVGGLPKVSWSFDQIGLAEIGGHHLVIRSSADLREADAIDQGLSDLDPAERSKLVRARRRHRAVVTLLHEVGHAMFAIHVDAKEQVMSPAYSSKTTGFGPDATDMLRIAVKHRSDGKEAEGRAALHAYYTAADKASWVSTERTQVIALLAAPKPAPAPSGPPPIPKVVAGLDPKDQATYEKSVALFEAGKALEAHQVGKPVFEKYLAIYEVQDFRCKVALHTGGTAWIKSECAALMEFAKKKKPQ